MPVLYTQSNTPFDVLEFNSDFSGCVLFEEALMIFLNRFLPDQNFYPLHIPQIATLPAGAFAVTEKTHTHVLKGAAGVCEATVEFMFMSASTDSYLEVLRYAEALRESLYGFQGDFGGGVYVLSALLDHEEHENEIEDDGSDNWVFQVRATYKIKYRESVPSLGKS